MYIAFYKAKNKIEKSSGESVSPDYSGLALFFAPLENFRRYLWKK